MLFPTVTFAVFFAIVLPLSWLLQPRAARWKLFTLAASTVFYGWWDWRFVGLLFASIAANQLAAELLHREEDERRRRLLLTSAVAANLALLGWFKYYGFFASSLAAAVRPLGVEPPLPLFEVVLPVGISFFTFHALSYVIDVYRREIAPATPLDFAVYMAFFPHLVAGPIVRASELVPQLRRRRDARHVDVGRAVALIGSGLIKKVVVANTLATALVDDVFASPGQHSALEVLVGIYGYAVQIYADFSGYTDIAIGCALLLGFEFPQNFDRPYSAVSIQDFWRRWHMTLSRWLRDYLYIPLGGGVGSRAVVQRNLMLTMLLGGLWHGAAWTFVVWGLLHGAYQAVGRLRPAPAMPLATPDDVNGWPLWRRRLVTFHLVCLAWVFFRADSFATATAVLRRLVTGWAQPSPAVTPLVVGLIVAALAAQQLPRDLGDRVAVSLGRLRPALVGVLAALGLLAVDAFGPQGVAPFIYFQF